jgi:hypothetical protein
MKIKIRNQRRIKKLEEMGIFANKDKNKEKLNIFRDAKKENANSKPCNILIENYGEDMQDLNRSVGNNIDLRSQIHTIPEFERPYLSSQSLDRGINSAESMNRIGVPKLINEKKSIRNMSRGSKPKLKLAANLSSIEEKPKRKINTRHNKSLFDTQDFISPYVGQDSTKSLTAKKSDDSTHKNKFGEGYKSQTRNFKSIKIKSRYGVTYNNRNSSLAVL